MTTAAPTDQRSVHSDLHELKLEVDAYLADSGWQVDLATSVARDHDGVPTVVPLWVAHHESLPSQRALTHTELVRRCHWQEDHRG